MESLESLIKQAEALEEKGDSGGASTIRERILVLTEQTAGLEHPDTATSLSNLASLYQDQGRYGEAESFYKRSLAIREKVLGPEHPSIASSLGGLGWIYLSQGRHEAAAPLVKRSLSIREKALGPEHPETATSLVLLGWVYEELHRYVDAETVYKRALSISEKAWGPEGLSTASSMTYLASLYYEQGRYGLAGPLFERALAISEKALGPEHPAVVNYLSNMAALAYQQRRYREADLFSSRSLSIYEKALGQEHPFTANSLNSRSKFLLEQKKPVAAEALLTRLNRSQANWLRRELPLQPRELRMGLLQQQPDALDTTFALLDQAPATAPLALETRLNRQGLLAEIEQRQRLLLGSSPRTRELSEQIAKLDRQLASITLTPAQRDGLRTQRQQLESELNRLLPALRIEPVSTAQVAGALKTLAPQGLLVEFQKLRPIGPTPAGKTVWGPPRYVALLLHPDGRIGHVPLGPAAPIDAAIGAALDASAHNLKDAPQLWGEVSRLLLSPLQGQLSGVGELFLSPDGELNRVPFAALPAPGGSGRLLSEQLPLRVLTTGRDLLRLKQRSAAGGAAVVIADPDYAYAGRTSAALASTGAAAVGSSPGSGSGGSQQRSGSLTSSWKALPGTAAEARLVAPLLEAGEPIIGRAATAARTLQQRAPRILHIATHGFFQPDGSETAAAEDPLLRSGLALAGANHPDANPGDDGYLTAAEATGMDLNGTELVTLSACETGLGSLRSGEGVYGLQRALTVAGARSTLLSLWKVNDAATAAFMAEYYGRLRKGEGRAQALAATQSSFRSHPNLLYRDVYVWAAFQLTGDWGPITAGR